MSAPSTVPFVALRRRPDREAELEAMVRDLRAELSRSQQEVLRLVLSNGRLRERLWEARRRVEELTGATPADAQRE